MALRWMTREPDNNIISGRHKRISRTVHGYLVNGTADLIVQEFLMLLYGQVEMIV